VIKPLTTKQLHEKASLLPSLPGVYIMKDKSGNVIYVGKAARLKNRVGSYFHGAHDPKTGVMASKVTDFDVIITNSEFEALVLENSLIKHHVPRYNIKLRDDKGYPYIRVDMNAPYPVFEIVAKPGNDEVMYLGPYATRTATREAIGAVSKAFKIPTCGKKLERIIGRERPCLNNHIGTCPAYCQDASKQNEYRESIEAAIDVFQGKTGAVINKLTGEMNDAASKYLFEIAAEKRDRIRAVESLEHKQLVVSGAMVDTDVIGFFRGAAKSCFAVLHFINGNLVSKDYELFDTPIEDDSDAISAITRQYYEKRGIIPGAVYLPVGVSDIELLEQYFSSNAGRRVCLFTPKRGDKAKLVETANINAREETERATSYEEKTLKTLQWLEHALKLEKPPERIEAFDISNTGGVDSVAAMTVFVKGIPYKRDYKRFKIKEIQGQDDYNSMVEVISRRIARFVSDDEKFAVLPDIILVDGGATHASVVRKTLDELCISVPVYGMVKDDKHKTRALVTPEGEEIGIQANPAVFAFIGKIQEETHRFAVEYHRTERSKNTYKSKLDAIPGVGEKRRNYLLKEFGSLKAVKAASVEELKGVVPKDVAERIFEYFH